MNRNDYIDRGARRRHAQGAVGMARLCPSAQALEETVAKTNAQHRRMVTAVVRWRNGAILTFILFLISIVHTYYSSIVALDNKAPQSNYPALGALIAFGILAVCTYIFDASDKEKASCEDVLRLLSPIAGSPLCHKAAHYVEQGHSDVLAWRDLAIAERGQLYAFDVEMMRYLHEMVGVLQQEQAMHEACLKAHGIAPAAAGH